MKISFIFIIFTLFIAFCYIIVYGLNRKKIQKQSRATKFILKYILLTISCGILGAWWVYLAFICFEFVFIKLLIIFIFILGFFILFLDDSGSGVLKFVGIVLVLVSIFTYFIINTLELKREVYTEESFKLELVQDSNFENTGDIIIEFENKDNENTEYAIMKYDKDKLKEFDLPKDYKLPLCLKLYKNITTENPESTITIKVIKEKITTLNSMFELSKPKTDVTFEYILDISQDYIKVH